MRLIQITDLHLSDRADTPGFDALSWAVSETNRLAPDLVAITGDVTTYGTEEAARNFLAAAAPISAPWVFTPGNAELRDVGAMPVLQPVAARKSIAVDGIHFLLPDTSTGTIEPADRAWLDGEIYSARPCVILTHYPMDVLDADSRDWVEAWLARHPVELYVAGHRHFDRTRLVQGCQEVITRGLDPDKAFGGPPSIHLFERDSNGSWTVQPIPWPHEQELLPAHLGRSVLGHSPVGWSIHGDPVATVQLTRRAGLHGLELRPKEPEYNLQATLHELELLRLDRQIYLSWHLPNLTWNSDTRGIDGQDAVLAQIEDGRACGVDAFTVHVPRIAAHLMYDADEAPSAAWRSFLQLYGDLFRSAVQDGVRISIENIHNAPGTPEDRSRREFATEISEYISWIDAVTEILPADGGTVGAHFDVGHARNNGELGNRQPLGDWYARVGSRITGYHIHQVRRHEETGKLTNHRDIRSAYDQTISYAGFLHAWSTKLINRAPLFIEVRDAEERRTTIALFEDLFTPVSKA